jgi:hypothetical protein
VRLKCQEPVEGQQLWVCLIRVPDRQRLRRFPKGQASLFGTTGQPGACIPIEYPMTKSSAEREKEGHMTPMRWQRGVIARHRPIRISSEELTPNSVRVRAYNLDYPDVRPLWISQFSAPAQAGL